MTTKRHTLYCDLCGKRFDTNSLKAFCNTMRSHRAKSHPDFTGKSILYTVAPPTKH